MAGASISATLIESKTLLFGKACELTSLKYINEDTAARFLQVFDAAAIADVTLGTTRPDYVLVAAQNAADNYHGSGLKFNKGIVVAPTTTATGSTAAADDKTHVFGEVR